MTEPMSLSPLPGDSSLRSEDLLCRRENWIAVNKPGGVLTQAPPGIDSVELRVYRWRQEQLTGGNSESNYVGVPHRLDRPVSGVMLLGLSRNMTRRLAELFQRREVTKRYWAVVEGEVAEDAGTWSDFMRKIPDEARSEIVSGDHPEAQLAVLNYRVLGRSPGRTWLRIELETGRTHQIRLQCSARGYPIVGDELYGARTVFGPQTTDLRERWIGLHARRLSFREPGGQAGNLINLVAPLYIPWEPLIGNFPQMLELENH
ncbi:MAG: RluA family pseudouridine synthase [Planctomycetota bacterium]|jgi:23S rRNA pseudouridine1911/1915/1917 synthase